MTLNDPGAFLFLCGVLVLLSSGWLRSWRRVIFLAASLTYVVMLYTCRANPGWLVFLGALIAVHYLTLRAMLRLRSPAARSALFYTWFAGAILTFLVVKRYDWVTGLFLPAADRWLSKP